MTMNDPNRRYDPNLTPGSPVRRNSMPTGILAIIAVIALLVIGGLIWGMNDRGGNSTASNPPSQTTGQGSRPAPAPSPPAQQK